MKPQAILNQLCTVGFTVTLDGPNQIRVTPRSALTEEIRALIKANKGELLALLAANEEDIHPAAQVDRVAQLHNAFLNHIMGPGKATNCCYAPVNRYCAEGKRLRDTYYGAVS